MGQAESRGATIVASETWPIFPIILVCFTSFFIQAGCIAWVKRANNAVASENVANTKI